MRSWTTLCLGALLLLSSCERAPSREEVIGTYVGALHGATETLVLRADGTLTQEVRLPVGRTLTGTGTWSLENEAVTLTHYIHFYDEAQNGALVEPERVHSIVYGWSSNIFYRDCGAGGYALHKRR